jgi:hypothetical protein
MVPVTVAIASASPPRRPYGASEIAAASSRNCSFVKSRTSASRPAASLRQHEDDGDVHLALHGRRRFDADRRGTQAHLHFVRAKSQRDQSGGSSLFVPGVVVAGIVAALIGSIPNSSTT